MSERQKPHAGRDRSGHRKVRIVDVEELLTDGPEAPDHLRDDVRLGGAVVDSGAGAGRSAAAIGDLIESNRRDVARVTRTETARSGRRARGSSGKSRDRDDRGMR